MKKSISTQGISFSYKLIGGGTPVVLIHGFGEDSTIWGGTIDYLKSKYLLLVPSLPGTEESSLLPKENAGLDDYAQCIKDMLKAESIEKCIMVGHSMGGYTALSFAEQFPELLNGLVLYHSSAYADSEEKKENRRKGIAFIQNHGAAAFVKTTLPNLFADIEKHKNEAKILEEKSKAFSADALVQYYHAMINRPDRTNVLKNQSIPLFFILGKHDKAVPYEAGIEQSQLNPCTRVHTLENSGHLGMLEQPEEANKTLASFLGEI